MMTYTKIAIREIDRAGNETGKLLSEFPRGHYFERHAKPFEVGDEQMTVDRGGNFHWFRFVKA
jgi:hypothetical protein